MPDDYELSQWCDCCHRTVPRGCVSKGGDRSDGERTYAVPSACCRCHQKAPGVDGDDCDLCVEAASLVEAINGLGGGHDAADER